MLLHPVLGLHKPLLEVRRFAAGEARVQVQERPYAPHYLESCVASENRHTISIELLDEALF
jgi:hypothetical protein